MSASPVLKPDLLKFENRSETEKKSGLKPVSEKYPDLIKFI